MSNQQTHINSYLDFTLAYPPKCKESLPYSQFLRKRRICKKDSDYLENIHKKKPESLDKGYPLQLINKAINKVNGKDRPALLGENMKNNNNENIIMATTTYRDGYQHFPKIVRNNWDILARLSTTKELHRKKVQIGYKLPKNLKDHLVKAVKELSIL